MTMGWDRLRVLDAVARTGSVTRAATVLHMSGPAVSQQLRRIEAEVRTKIVVPDGRGLRLTAKGEVLAGYARQVADAMQQAENDLHRDETYVGHLRVAAIASAIRSVLGSKLAAFHREYPRVRVSVEDGETADHLARLAAGAVDLVLAESWSASPLRLPTSVVAEQITREALFIAMPGDHSLRSHDPLSIRDLAGERWATCAQGSDAHTAIEQVARRHGVELDVSFHVADHLTRRAEGAVDELSRFQDGLRATHENTTQSNNTVIGHSYGSTVVGHTAQSEDGLNADEIVLVGSPGADAQHASELGFLPENVHASTAKNDGITGLTDLTHGADPTSPEFGATVFDSNPGSSDGAWPLRDAHSEYFQEDNASLEYMGEVIAGQNKND